MRIFHLCADRGIRPDGTKGAAVHFRSLAVALREAGHSVTAFCAAGARGETPFPVPVLVLRSSQSVLDAARAHGAPDLVYERYSLRGLWGLAASRDLGVPFFLEVNAPLVHEARRYRPDTVEPEDEPAERRLFREADHLFAVSGPLRDYAAKLRGTRRGTSVLRNGCDPDRFPEPAGGPGPPLLAFLGHPRPWHGAERLPRLIAALTDEGYDLGLLVIGGGQGTAPILREAERYGVGDRVRVTGAVAPSVAAQLLGSATVGIAPYAPTPFFYFCPLKVIEYMAAGLPLVTTDLGDLEEIVGDAGRLVPAADEEALAAEVRALLDDPGLRARLGKEGRRRAREQFTWQRTAAQLEMEARRALSVAKRCR